MTRTKKGDTYQISSHSTNNNNNTKGTYTEYETKRHFYIHTQNMRPTTLPLLVPTQEKHRPSNKQTTTKKKRKERRQIET